MKIVNSIKDLKAYLAEAKQDNKKIGFVPTMGALHNGHLSLVQHCVKNNDVCVVSVFVNPTQFNDKHDLETYPRTLEADCVLLESAGCDYVFAPSVEEMYPEPDTRTFDLGTVSEVMEGAKRPGHFNGVAQVVSKLFYIVEPDNAYFGEKDFQQIAVIRAPLIARTLKEITTFVPGKSVQEVIDYVVNTINSDPVMEVEYYEIVDGNTLESIKNWSDTDYPVGCITVYCGEVRLIDNIKY